MRHRATLLIVAIGLLHCTRLESAEDRFDGIASSAGIGGTPARNEGGSAGTARAEGGAAGENQGGSTSIASGNGGGSCIDPLGFHGKGCYRCKPTDIFTLESACTSATCTPFDNKLRLTKLPADGKLPALPAETGQGSSGGNAGSGGVAGAGGAGGSAPTSGSGSGAGFQCSELSPLGSVVYVTGSTAVKPFLQQIAQQLVASGVYIVYTSTGSCVGVDAILNRTPMTTGPAPAPAATATYWESSASSGKACDLPSEGVHADLGISDVFAQTCPGFELANLDAQQVEDAHGPIQIMTFAVPSNSPYFEISAQAAYFVFGFGAAGGVLDTSGKAPIWNDNDQIFQRSASSGTQAMLAAAIGVDSRRWRGKSHKTSDDVLLSLQAASTKPELAQKSIGILAADYIETRNLRAQIRMLAYQDTKQPCAVYPDSSESARDKRNVRDGHYPIWGPLHLLRKIDRSGTTSPARRVVTDILGYLSGTKPLPNGVKLIDVYAQSGLVPECAMRVTRLKDGGNILPTVPASPCSCLFELKATGSTTCKKCDVQGDCSADESCSQGYCEK